MDWGEVSYLNEVLPETDAIDYACIDTEEERGFEIIRYRNVGLKSLDLFILVIEKSFNILNKECQVQQTYV